MKYFVGKVLLKKQELLHYSETRITFPLQLTIIIFGVFTLMSSSVTILFDKLVSRYTLETTRDTPSEATCAYILRKTM